MFQIQEDEWLTENDTIKGFEWRSGCDLVTTGIYIWSKPYIRVNKSGQKVRSSIKFQYYNLIKIVFIDSYHNVIFERHFLFSLFCSGIQAVLQLVPRLIKIYNR